MTSAELRALLGRLSDDELEAAITIANTILLSRGRPSPGSEKRQLREDLLRARADLQEAQDQLRQANDEIAELRHQPRSAPMPTAVPHAGTGTQDAECATTPYSAYCLDCGRVLDTVPDPPVCDCTGRVVPANFNNPIAHILERRRQRRLLTDPP